MPDGSGQPVDDRFLIFVDMTVGVGNPVGMEVGVVMLMAMLVFMFMFVFVKLVQVSSSASGSPVFSHPGTYQASPPFAHSAIMPSLQTQTTNSENSQRMKTYISSAAEARASSGRACVH